MVHVNTTTDGFRPAQRLVDLANLVRHRPDASREQLTAVLAAHGEADDELAELTAADAARLRAMAGTLGDVLALTDVDIAAQAINTLLDRHTARPRLSNHDGTIWHLHVERDSGWDSWLAASGALALAQLLSERGRPAWGECATKGCRNLFLDDGPGSPRRYCSTQCANRARVAEHRARKRGDG
ncbi:MAG: CGNR zinc finger domain-containing protein [Stackebrandtia sp.]